MTPARRRLVALAALVVVVAAGLVAAKVLPSSAATDIAGDALYAVAVYTGLVLLLPRVRRLILAIAATGWCVFVELLQLSGLPVALAERVPPIALVLGTGFDTRDLVVYASAVLVAAAADAAVTSRVLRRGRSTVCP
ncbi:ribosomal maturation YjgA family protein [Microbacterium proteolyticum]|uniref:ribosomal maturation YjgA family protein n=1 Tax=Microbacterium proteolyticum TaxID=1572644 RepID=UPI001FABC852|nr:DUF2809 domain-containing protein [Microbacterium proteolyticum]MCI9857270.1 DUF2809 domain-containing protein [Microbacterium proteolyticum]